VRVVRFVKRAQQLGFTLADIEELLHLAEGGPAACEEAKAMARADGSSRRSPRGAFYGSDFRSRGSKDRRRPYRHGFESRYLNGS
jgi:DNA-binding transcriptional MerR regulator